VSRGLQVALAMLALTVSLSGCAGRAPFTFFGAGKSSAKPDAPKVAGQSTYDGFTADPKSAPADKGNMFSNGFSKVADAMTIKPKVTKADDAVSLSSKPKDIGAEVYLSLARMHENRGDFNTAINQYRKALEVAPKDLTTLVSLARLYDRQGQFDQAEELYQRAVKAHPNSAVALNDQGLCYARQNKLSESLAALQKAVKIEPDKAMYRNNLASVLVESGRNPEAFDQLAAVNPPAVAHYNMGYLLYQRKQHEAAAQHFARAVEADPSMAAARQMLAQLDPARPASGPSAARIAEANAPPPAARENAPAQYTVHATPAGQVPAERMTAAQTTTAQVTVVQPFHDFLPTRLPHTFTATAEDDSRSNPPTPSDFKPATPSAPNTTHKFNAASHKYR
jgi:Flp pilus assembly protein TadD